MLRARERQDLQRRSFLLACDIVRFCVELFREGSVPKNLITQLLDAGTSIGANLEEAKSATSRKDFALKYEIGAREARETGFWLRLMTETRLVPAQRSDALIRESDEFVAILTASARRLRHTDR